MSDKFIVEGALCTCKFGTAPARLIILSPDRAHMNGGKSIADTMNIGNVFQPPGFAMCNSTYPPKPCVPAVIQWSGAFDQIKFNRVTSPLLSTSKGTCALGCPHCIEFIKEGQTAMPGAGQMNSAAADFQGDMDPLGESLALYENQIEAFGKIMLR
ncbi:PAAR-like protein [Porphyromonas gulae]|uniref:PAAR-like protein n=1 Tax=Porphyromonas gulae TaxID=111105 RepID=UPI00068C99B3|nr:PAAR-like protein [Porphyromonas gulae]